MIVIIIILLGEINSNNSLFYSYNEAGYYVCTIQYYFTAILDYDAFVAPLIFPLGSMPMQQECFNIQQFIVNDLAVENQESFRIMLSSTDPSAQFTPGRDCATTNIIDNDRRFLS